MHDFQPIAALGAIAAVVYGVIRGASKATSPKSATPLNLTPSESPRPVRRTPPIPTAVQDHEMLAWRGQWQKYLYSKVMGVAYNNDDGSSRQRIIQGCKVGELLDLVRDPNNPHSRNRTAIRIVRRNGEMLGYVQSEISEILADQMDRGSKVEARITLLTGGTSDRPTRGVNIIIGQNHAPRRKKAVTA